MAHEQDVDPEPDASSAAARTPHKDARVSTQQISGNVSCNHDRGRFGRCSTFQELPAKNTVTLADQSILWGPGGRAERLGILTEFTWSCVRGCRARMDGAERMDAKARRGRSRRLQCRRWRRERTARRDAGSNPRVCVFCSHLLPDGLLGCGFPLQTNTTVTRRHWIRMRGCDGKDTFPSSLVSIGCAAPIVQTQFAEYGQLVPR